jgi:transposase-like protein
MTGGKKRRHYDEPFKRQVVGRLLKSGKSVAAFAELIGVDRTNLQKWKKIYRNEVAMTAAVKDGKKIEVSELMTLKREMTLLQETVDKLRAIVKKNLENRYADDRD